MFERVFKELSFDLAQGDLELTWIHSYMFTALQLMSDNSSSERKHVIYYF